MSLATGARIARHRWTELPITNTAIARVEALAITDDMPLIQERGLVVEWRPGQPIDDDEYDANYHLPNQPPVDDFAPGDYDPLDAEALAALHEPHLDPDNALHLQDQGALDVNVPIQHDAVSDYGQDDDDHDVDYYAAEPYGPDVAQADSDSIDQDEHGDNSDDDADDGDGNNYPVDAGSIFDDADDDEEDNVPNALSTTTPMKISRRSKERSQERPSNRLQHTRTTYVTAPQGPTISGPPLTSPTAPHHASLPDTSTIRSPPSSTNRSSLSNF